MDMHCFTICFRVFIHNYLSIQVRYRQWYKRAQKKNKVLIVCWVVLGQLETRYSHLRRGNLNYENASIRLGCT